MPQHLTRTFADGVRVALHPANVPPAEVRSAWKGLLVLGDTSEPDIVDLSCFNPTRPSQTWHPGHPQQSSTQPLAHAARRDCLFHVLAHLSANQGTRRAQSSNPSGWRATRSRMTEDNGPSSKPHVQRTPSPTAPTFRLEGLRHHSKSKFLLLFVCDCHRHDVVKRPWRCKVSVYHSSAFNISIDLNWIKRAVPPKLTRKVIIALASFTLHFLLHFFTSYQITSQSNLIKSYHIKYSRTLQHN